MCHCLPPRKSEFEPFFGKIKISTFPVTECHLIIIKNDLQSYSSVKGIISVKLIVKASKNKKI